MHRGGLRALRPAASPPLHAGAVLQDAGRDGGAVPRPAAGARQQRGDRASAATSPSSSARPSCRAFRRPTTSGSTNTSAQSAAAGLERRLRAALSRRAGARASEKPRYRERLEFELDTIVQMGFPGYFLIVADFINWAKGERRAGRAGARLGRRLARRLQPRHHRPRSAALRPAVRALPQSRARVDAGLRHRFLPGRARPRHRVREAEVRRRERVADRDLRHHGGEGGGARRRAACSTSPTRSATSSRS